MGTMPDPSLPPAIFSSKDARSSTETTRAIVSDPPPPPPPPPGRCAYYVARKKRYCKQSPHPGSEYCGTHRKTTSAGDGSIISRVQCPYGDHLVDASQLEKHIPRCPDYKRLQTMLTHPCYSLGINAGSKCDSAPSPLSQPHLTVEDAQQQQQRQRWGSAAGTIAAARQAMAMNLGPDAFEKLVGRIKSVEQAISKRDAKPEVVSQLTPAGMERYVAAAAAGERKLSPKHAAQQASIVGHMAEFGLFKDAENTTYVEFGAGKGYLACMLHDCHPQASRLVLVDKDSFSHIADRSLRHTELQRIRLDIADFDARGIPGIDPGDAWVAFGKHLCGAATDLTLRCCERHHHRSRSGGFLNDGVVSQQRAAHAVADKGRPHPHQKNQKEQGEIPILDGRHTTALKGPCDPPLLGLALATCCHHRCEWHSYVGKEVLHDVGFSARECELMCWMSGWALCGHEAQTPCGEGVSENDVVDDDHHGGLESVDMDTQAETDAGGGCVAPERTNCDGEQRRQDAFYKPWRPHYTYSRKDRMCIGRACKRILDYGREEWLRRCGFEVASLLYVHPEWSGENRLILARCQGGAAKIGSKSQEHVRG